VAQKAEARRAAFAARKAAFQAGQGQAAELLADVLRDQQGRVLAGYMPMRTEIDPLPAMAAHQGPVCVPVIPGPDMPLRFREWSPGCPMLPGEFGALIPAEGAWLEPEVLIVPLWPSCVKPITDRCSGCTTPDAAVTGSKACFRSRLLRGGRWKR
jgi:5-formyltetrahydrofolate cyclo-ligase